MPKMRLLTSVAGDGFAWSEGEVVTVDEKTAATWCDGVRAERVEQKRRPRTPIETAVAVAPENTAARSSG